MQDEACIALTTLQVSALFMGHEFQSVSGISVTGNAIQSIIFPYEGFRVCRIFKVICTTGKS
jgi:hypothetical protein